MIVIERKQQDDTVEIALSGRLDAQGAEHLDQELSDAVRSGARHIRLDMAETGYLSSAGIRTLMSFWKQMRAVNGSFRVVSPSEPVLAILRMVGMLELFEEQQRTDEKEEQGPDAFVHVPEGGGRFSIVTLDPGATFSLHLHGSPDRFSGAGFSADDMEPLSVTGDLLAIGLGAFGDGFGECRDLFGEFMALGGAAICLPTDTAQIPDFQVSAGLFTPMVQTLYVAACRGDFSRFFNFSPDDSGAPLGLSRMADMALSVCGSGCAGIVMVAEADGLVGARLRKSPAGQGDGDAFSFPGVRDWLAMTTEPVCSRSLTLVAGIVATDFDVRLAPFLRPISSGSRICGHLHAAALSYRALPDGPLNLPATISSLLETQNLTDMLHLFTDDREISGIGESTFIRGAAWVGPITMGPHEKGAP